MHRYELYGYDKKGEGTLINSFNASGEFYFDLMGSMARAGKGMDKYKRFRLVAVDFHGQVDYAYEISELKVERGKIVE